MDPERARPRDADVEAQLREAGAGSLADLLGGDEAVRALSDLARAADTAGAGGEQVLVVPGVMGSTLGLRGALWDDVIWLDLVDIALGRLAWLSLDDGDPRVEPLGVLLPAYLPLKLRLRLAGFEATLHPWDWRLGLRAAAEGLARAVLAAPGRVHVVGHSMGGLVAQAVLALGPEAVRERLGRVVTLGTPSWGAPAVATVLQGTHPAVARLAALHPGHDARVLARDVFGSFPSTHLLLPWRDRWRGPDLDHPSTWSAAWPAPRPELLARARDEQAELAAARPGVAGRLLQVVGVGQPTVVALDPGDEPDDPLATTTSTDGDGTVPRGFAELDGAPTWYSTASHGALPRSLLVVEAVGDLLREGTTARLPSRDARRPDGADRPRRGPPGPDRGRRGHDPREAPAPVEPPATREDAPPEEARAGSRWSWLELRRLAQEFVGGADPEPSP